MGEGSCGEGKSGGSGSSGGGTTGGGGGQASSDTSEKSKEEVASSAEGDETLSGEREELENDLRSFRLSAAGLTAAGRRGMDRCDELREGDSARDDDRFKEQCLVSRSSEAHPGQDGCEAWNSRELSAIFLETTRISSAPLMLHGAG